MEPQVQVDAAPQVPRPRRSLQQVEKIVEVPQVEKIVEVPRVQVHAAPDVTGCTRRWQQATS